MPSASGKHPFRGGKVQVGSRWLFPFPNLIPVESVARMWSEMEALFALESTAELGMPKECTNMQNKSSAFDACFTHPRLLAAVAHVLREDFRSLGIHSRPICQGVVTNRFILTTVDRQPTGHVLCLQLNVDADRLYQGEWSHACRSRIPS